MDDLLSGRYLTPLVALDDEIADLVASIAVTREFTIHACSGGGEVGVRDDVGDVGEVRVSISFERCRLGGTVLDGALMRIASSSRDIERRHEHRELNAALTLDRDGVEPLEFVSRVDLTNTWSADRVCGGRRLDIALQVDTTSAIVPRDGRTVQVRNSVYGANENILDMPEDAPSGCRSTRSVSFDGAALAVLEPGSRTSIPSRKIGHLEYTDDDVMFEQPTRLSLNADDGLFFEATLVDAVTGEIRLAAWSGDAASIGAKQLFYRFEP